MAKIRTKIYPKNHNVFFEYWIGCFSKEARRKALKVANIYDKALKSLQKYPVALHSAKECEILNGFGPVLCGMLDVKLKAFSTKKSVSVEEALKIGNSMTKEALAILYKNEEEEKDHLNLQPIELVNFLEPPKSDIQDVHDAGKQLKLFGGSYNIVLLLDTRETFGMKKLKESMQKALYGISAVSEVRSLPVGDFAWVARPIDPVGVKEELKEVVLGIIVERKRADDLASSIVDGRFKEQQSRMEKLGFRKIYLFEECKVMENLRIAYETLLQSLINAQLIDGCEVINCSNGDQSIAYLSSLTHKLHSKSNLDLSVYCSGARPDKSSDLRTNLWGIPWTEFATLGKKSPLLPLREEFAHHLLQIPTMTGPRVEAILSSHSTPFCLIKAYDSIYSLDAKKELLTKHKAINKNLSQFLYYTYTVE